MTGDRARILDAEALQCLPLDGLKLIEASAGTGKTHTITNLYLRYVLAGLQPRQLLVVTFTNAATDELRGRIRQRLHHMLRQLKAVQAQRPVEDSADQFEQYVLRHHGSDPGGCEDAILRLTLAVRSMDEAAIHTIHGFCQRALSDHAVRSGQSMEVTLLADDAPLWDEALQDWWRRRVTTLARPQLDAVLAAIGGFDSLCRRQRELRGGQQRRLFPAQRSDVASLLRERGELLAGLQSLASEWQTDPEALYQPLLQSGALRRTKDNGYKKDALPATLESLDAWWRSGAFDPLHPDFHLLCQDYVLGNVKPSVEEKGGDPALEKAFYRRCQDVLDAMESLRERLSISLLDEAHAEASALVEQRKQQRHVMAYSDQLTRLSSALHGEDGDVLAADLRRDFPVAMIDEFQDTDALQYHIFRRIYPDELLEAASVSAEEEPGGAVPRALIMIGDPKQAIYSFRGGDIFTYMEARRSADRHRYTLQTNWRSTPELVGAINTLFRYRGDAFVFRDAIDFEAVEAADKDHAYLVRNGTKPPPLTFWHLPFNPEQDSAGRPRPWNKDRAAAMAAGATAMEIARLLDGATTLGKEPLRAGDVAVLVRTHHEAGRVREQLALRGIPAVTVSRDSVFQSEEAHGLLLLLRGIVHCHDRQRMRQALASSLLAFDHSTLAASVEEEEHWLSFAGCLRELQNLWRRRGFMVAFQQLMEDLRIGERITEGLDPERRMTNVLQLAELIQQQSGITPGMEGLLAWYERQLQHTDAEESELRLESDSALVHIITIHASKGLQYPVVFVPFLSTTMRVEQKDEQPVHFHDGQGRACTDLAPSARESHLALADRERLAEDVRLLYVALTRARARLYLVWGNVGARGGTAAHTALAWLLYSDRAPEDLTESRFQMALGDNEDEFLAPLRALQRQAPDQIECGELPVPTAESVEPVAPEVAGKEPALAVAGFHGRIDTDWRIASFSALTRDVHQVPHGGSPRSGLDPVLDFPAGSRVGLYLHALLEELDFAGDVREQAGILHDRLAPRYGLDADGFRPVVRDWMEELVRTPLGIDGLRLQDIPASRRLNELEFDFAVQSLDMLALNRDLEALAGRTLEPIAVDDFRGLVTGVIDLVFEYDGRYYLADYKSNHLGGALTDYRAEALEQAVLDRRYDVQYLLYSLALHRYLRQRLTGYDYDRHFGGAFYFFLRGMRSHQGSDCGIWHRKPDRTLIEQLDRRLYE